MVIDWRAPVSLPFYRATRTDPMGVELRRRFGFQHGSLTSFEDEDLTAGTGADYSAILEQEIERPRVGPMRDIVATIQPEQDVIVRSDLSQSICVQGAPGTGKTAVGLHRAAYLLFAHREQLTRQGVLVVGPNASFLRYIRDVLPALGEVDATQSTIAELAARALREVNAKWSIRGEEPAAVATLKGDARLAEVLARALWSHVTMPTEGLVVPRGARRWRVATYEVEELVRSLRSRGVRYGAARAMVPQALAHRVLVRMELAGDSPDDRVQDAVARSKPVKDYAAAVWPAVDPARLVWRLLSDATFLAAAADGLLSEEEQAALTWAKPPKSPASTPWTLAEAILVDEAADLVERTGSVGHIVADEAQDLSPMMLRALARRSSTGSLTVLGDLAQATTPWATRSWAEALGHLGKPDAHVEQLTRGFRVPGEVIEYAARLLPVIAPGLEPPTSVRRARGELEIVPLTSVAVLVSRRHRPRGLHRPHRPGRDGRPRRRRPRARPASGSAWSVARLADPDSRGDRVRPAPRPRPRHPRQGPGVRPRGPRGARGHRRRRARPRHRAAPALRLPDPRRDLARGRARRAAARRAGRAAGLNAGVGSPTCWTTEVPRDGESVRSAEEGRHRGRPAREGEDRRRPGRAVRLQDQLLRLRRP